MLSSIPNSKTAARDNRQSVQFFDVDLFRNKLECYMRKQATEMCEVVNNKKRKFSERWTDMDKEEMELAEDYRDDLCFQFNKRQRGHSYYPLDDDELDDEEVSPLALPSPVSVREAEISASASSSSSTYHSAQSYFDLQPSRLQEQADDDDDDDQMSMSMSMAMRRELSGYSEVSMSGSTQAGYDEDDDSWMSPCPPLSRGSLSSSSSRSASSMPHTPNNGRYMDTDGAEDDVQSMADLEHGDAMDAASSIDLDLSAMAPHERNLLAALAPERFEKAALIKRAFRQSDKLLDQFARENRHVIASKQQNDTEMVQMDDGEYDQVFGELMTI